MKSTFNGFLKALTAPALALSSLGLAFPAAAQQTDTSLDKITVMPRFDLDKFPLSTLPPVPLPSPEPVSDPDNPVYKMDFAELMTHFGGDKDKAWEVYEYYQLRQINLHEAVSDISANRIIQAIEILDKLDPEKPITLSINSPGGSVPDGLRIYNAMMAAKSPVNTYCDTQAASMAAILFVAGDHRVAGPGCQFLIHETSWATKGKASEMLQGITNTLAFDAKTVQILSENSGLSVSDLDAIRKYDLYYSSEDLVEMGFADEISGEKPRKLEAGSRRLPAHLRPNNKMRDLIDKKFDLNM